MHCRSKGSLALLLASAAVSAGGTVWWSLASASRARVESNAPGAEGAPSALVPPDKVEQAAAAHATGSEVLLLASAPTIAAESEREPPRSLRIDGFVRIPPETPRGESLHVVARAAGHERRVRVEPGGAFQVELWPENGGKALEFDLDAEHLYLPEPVRIPSGPPRSVLIEPVLGALIEGSVVPPLGEREAARMAGRRVFATSVEETVPPGARRSGRLGRDLRFQLRGVQAHRKHRIWFQPGRWVEARRCEVELLPGQTVELELHFLAGVRVEGCVLDVDGQPVAKAAIVLHRRLPESGALSGALRRTASRADGSFALEGLDPGASTLVATKEGYAAAALALGEVAEGGELTGIRLQLRRGHELAGRVVWPRGEPAPGAIVVIGERPAESGEPIATLAGGACAGRTDENGYFLVSGSGPGPFIVAARARPTFGSDTGTDGHARTPWWYAEAGDVAAGSAELQLVLEPGVSLTGRVVDDAGVPIPRFLVRARPCSLEEAAGFVVRKPRVLGVESADGLFVLDGLASGPWEIVVDADGHVSSAPKVVRLPIGEEPQEFSLARAATVRGRALAPGAAGGARSE